MSRQTRIEVKHDGNYTWVTAHASNSRHSHIATWSVRAIAAPPSTPITRETRAAGIKAATREATVEAHHALQAVADVREEA